MNFIKNLKAVFTGKKPVDPVEEKAKIDVDWTFIGSLEGKAITKGYVPRDSKGRAIGMSGVTIGTGVDLGQQNMHWLMSLPITPALKDKLHHYLGHKKAPAIAFLKKNPLTLTPEEVTSLDRAVKHKQLQSLIGDWDAVAEVPFKFLDPAIQTVLASLHYQYGNLPKRTPRFWKIALTRDIALMQRHLSNFGDAFRTRRTKEAKYLENTKIV